MTTAINPLLANEEILMAVIVGQNPDYTVPFVDDEPLINYDTDSLYPGVTEQHVAPVGIPKPQPPKAPLAATVTPKTAAKKPFVKVTNNIGSLFPQLRQLAR